MNHEFVELEPSFAMLVSVIKNITAAPRVSLTPKFFDTSYHSRNYPLCTETLRNLKSANTGLVFQ